MFSPSPNPLTSPIEMFSIENSLDNPQHTEMKRTIINLNKEFKEIKEDIEKTLSALKGDSKKHLRYVQEKTSS